MAVLAEGKCKCGRQWLRLSRVEGRKQELVITSDGSVITLTALVFGQHYKAFSNIVRMQLAQKVPGEITIRIQASDNYSPERDEKEILTKIEDAAGSGFKVKFEYPDRISRTPRGKHIFLEQELQIEDFLS
jgi:phenylacetate-CoA ligase